MYGWIEKPPSALIVPIEDGHVWLIEQFRHPVGRRFWEFPQGAWEGVDASPEDLARGELAEETGLRAASMEPLGRLHFAYGLTDQFVDVWRATGLEPGPQALEETEEGLIVRRFSVSTSSAMVRGATRSAMPRRLRHGTWLRADRAVAHDDVAAQQAGHLPRSGPMERLAELQLQPRPLPHDPARDRARVVAQPHRIDLGARPVQPRAAHEHAIDGQLVARADDDLRVPRCAARTTAPPPPRRAPCAARP